VLNLAARLCAEPIERACLRADNYKNYSYWVIEVIPTKKLDELDLDTKTLEDEQQTPGNNNIRGNKYYQ
jgi:hypothetical protein